MSAELDAPPRSLLGHFWRSTLAGAVSGTLVVALGLAVGRTVWGNGRGVLSELIDALLFSGTYGVAAGTVIGVIAGLAAMSQRGGSKPQTRRRTARTLGLVVALPGGVLVFATWGFSTASNVLFGAVMLASVLYVGVGTYLTARASLLFVVGADCGDLRSG